MANYAGNMIQGAGTGAAAGAAFGPWGAAIGGGVGLVAGFFNAWSEAEDEKERQKILDQAKQQLGANYSQLQGMINEYYANNKSIGSKEDIDTYRKLIGDYDPYEFVYGEDTDGDGIADTLGELDYDIVPLSYFQISLLALLLYHLKTHLSDLFLAFGHLVMYEYYIILHLS